MAGAPSCAGLLLASESHRTPSHAVPFTAVASGDKVTTARLLHEGAVANGKLGAVAGAISSLDAEDKAKLKRAREEGRLVEEERLLKKARKALSDRGAEANCDSNGSMLHLVIFGICQIPVRHLGLHDQIFDLLPSLERGVSARCHAGTVDALASPPGCRSTLPGHIGLFRYLR